MASIVSSLGAEKERRMLGLFPKPVRLHLLYKSSHHGADIDTLLNRFDKSGRFVLTVFLQSGVVRGGFMSGSLKDVKKIDDEEAFLFEIDEKVSRFPVVNPASAVQVHLKKSSQINPSVPTPAVSFGAALHLFSTRDGLKSKLSVNFSRDPAYSCRWAEEQDAPCLDVELHRVEDVGDVLPNPWREMSWTEETRKSLRENFASYKLSVKTVSQVRTLLLGPVGSGKSSLINSIRSTMFRRVIHLPNVGTTTGSFTRKLKSYDIRAEKGGPPTTLTLCDVMAIGDEDFSGLSLSDTLAVIKGHVPDGYEFQSIPISDKVGGFRAAPTFKHQVHSVFFVLDASKVTSYPVSLRNNLRKLHTTISDMGIPQVILLTHVDQVCCAVKEDLKCVYSSRTLQEKMQKAAELVGLPLSYVFPVKNYVSQLTVDCNTDILLLSAVSCILHAVDDTLEDDYPDESTVHHTQIAPNSNVLL